jgi:DNA-directed RNA polymerase specialized sigma24 family protein
MKENRDLTQVEFDRLLVWLDSDRERAAEQYEVIRQGLIELFESRCCSDSEHLADKTINTVARKVEQIAPTYTGKPAHYFYGVAKHVLHEYFRNRTLPLVDSTAAPMVGDSEDREQLFDCLDHCLNELSVADRELILTYYRAIKREKIDLRQQLTTTFGLTGNALRVRAHRIRKNIERCILHCLELDRSGRNKSN